MTDFSECIIIPIDIFEQQCQPMKETKNLSILDDPTIPSDVKVKLYRQEERLNKPVDIEHEIGKVKSIQAIKRLTDKIIPSDTTTHTSSKTSDISSFIKTFKSTEQPYINSILVKIMESPQQISWNEKQEVTINGVHFPNSNIIDLLQFIRNKKLITSSDDIPVAAAQFHSILEDINVPSTWLRVSKQNLKSAKQKGSGIIKWIKF